MRRLLEGGSYLREALIRWGRLLDRDAYFGINVHVVLLIRGRRLFETRHFIEEIR